MKLEKLFKAGIAGNCLAIIAGALLTLAFAPLRLYPLAILIPALLYRLWQTLTPAQAFRRGWLFGLGLFGAGVYWIFISIYTYGNAPLYLAVFFTVALIAILSIFTGLNGYLLKRFFSHDTDERLFYAFPAIWVSLEWMRSIIFTGFPWLLLGYTQTSSPLRGYAPLFGIYCVSLVTLVCSGLLYKTFIYIKQKEYRNAAILLLIFISFFLGGQTLSLISWTHPFGQPVQVSLVQGNIPQETKWSADMLQPTLDKYRSLTDSHWDSKIIVWPEAAIPLPIPYAESFLKTMYEQAIAHNANFITGIPVQSAAGDTYYNAVILLGAHNGKYFKHLLVPYGEYVPFRGLAHKLLDVLNLPMSDFIPAPDEPVVPLQADNIKISAFICYEIAYPELVLTQDASINMLLTVSNDAWFGHSVAQAQHLEMAQMRAIELGRPLLFVSNNGITAIINAKGKIQSAAPPYETYVLTDKVQPMEGKTTWQRVGMDPILYILAAMILLAIRIQRKLKHKTN